MIKYSKAERGSTNTQEKPWGAIDRGHEEWEQEQEQKIHNACKSSNKRTNEETNHMRAQCAWLICWVKTRSSVSLSLGLAGALHGVLATEQLPLDGIGSLALRERHIAVLAGEALHVVRVCQRTHAPRIPVSFWHDALLAARALDAKLLMPATTTEDMLVLGHKWFAIERRLALEAAEARGMVAVL